MTTSTQAATAVTRRPAQWKRATWILLRINLERAAWFWVFFLGGLAATVFVISRFAAMQMSTVQFGYHAVLWFQFAMMIAVFVGYAGVHVANGMTRRSFTVGSLIGAAGAALGYGLIITLTLLAESWAYDRLGWYHGLSNIRGEVLATGLWPYFWGAILVFAVGDLSGLLVGATYYRFGGWWGTLCLPLTLAPLLLVSTVVMDQRIQWTPWDLTTDILGGARPVAAVVVIAAGVAAYVLLVRRMPIPTRPS